VLEEHRVPHLRPALRRRWLALWDPSVYLPRARLPMLWVTGTNDFAYPLDSLQRSYRLPRGPRSLCIRVEMPHGHGPPGENPEEIAPSRTSICGADRPSPDSRGAPNKAAGSACVSRPRRRP